MRTGDGDWESTAHLALLIVGCLELDGRLRGGVLEVEVPSET